MLERPAEMQTIASRTRGRPTERETCPIGAVEARAIENKASGTIPIERDLKIARTTTARGKQFEAQCNCDASW